MLVTDFSKRVSHIAVNTTPGKGKTPVHQGLIFNPGPVFSKINTNAERYFAEFFLAGQQYRLVCLLTEMGPGELVKVFGKRFGAECSVWIGGIIAPFSIKSDVLECFYQELTRNPKQFFRSAEKKIFTRRPIRGLTVKV